MDKIRPPTTKLKSSDTPRAKNGATVRIGTSRQRTVLSWSQAPAPPPWRTIGEIAALVVRWKLPDDA